MAIYNPLIPGDTQTIAAGPKDIRDNMDGIVTGQVVNAGLLNGLASGNTAGKIPVSNGVVNEGLNADKLDGQDGSYFSPSTHGHSVATGSSNGYMANTDKTKIDGIAAGAEVNQNAFSNVLVGGTTIQADSKTDTLEFVAGANISITPDVTNDRVTIAVSGTVPSATSADSATNADTVDGLHASAFALSSHGTHVPASGTTAKYLRGDNTWQNMPTSLPANGGNADTATTAGTATLLQWRNYGSPPHFIVDNSKSEYPGGNTNAQTAWTPTFPVLMGYNGSMTYGVRVDSARVADSAGSAYNIPTADNGGNIWIA